MKFIVAYRTAGFLIAVIPGLSLAGLPTINYSFWQGVTISPSFLAVGSGVPVSKCHVLTNEHVIRHNTKPEIRYAGEVYRASLSAQDDQNDMALLNVDGCPFQQFATVADRAPQVGEKLTSTYYSPGFNFFDRMSKTTGLFIGYKKIRVQNEFEMDSMIINDQNPRVGSSGGGVSSERGLVSVIFGVATKYSEPKTYAVKYQALKRFLGKNLI